MSVRRSCAIAYNYEGDQHGRFEEVEKDFTRNMAYTPITQEISLQNRSEQCSLDACTYLTNAIDIKYLIPRVALTQFQVSI